MLVAAAALDPAARSEEQQTLAKFYRRVAPELAPVRAGLRAAELRGQALVDDVPQSLGHGDPGAASRCASCRAATGWTRRARS